MRTGAIAFVALVMSATVVAWAGDGEAARKLVDKAMEAQGGEAKLTKWQGVTAKFKGTFHGLGQEVPVTGEVATQGPDRLKVVLNIEAGGAKLRIIQVLNGDNGWSKLNDETKDMGKDELAEAKQQAHSDWIATLTPLKDKAFTLAAVGDAKVDKKPVVGVKVSRNGYRDTLLYFDKQTGLLVKTEKRVKGDDGQEATQEDFYADYKDVQGTKQATKVRTIRNGKPYMDAEITNYRLSEKLNDAVFAKP